MDTKLVEYIKLVNSIYDKLDNENRKSIILNKCIIERLLKVNYTTNLQTSNYLNNLDKTKLNEYVSSLSELSSGSLLLYNEVLKILLNNN